jgi:hypothetical protein
VRRGQKILAVIGRRALTEEAILLEAIGLLSEHKLEREPRPVIVVDREGPIGSQVFYLLRAHAAANPEAFAVEGVRSSDKAHRQPDLFDRVRDELWESMRQWLASGGAIPEDAKLARELHAPSWDASGFNNRLKATPKSEIRKLIDRSPDRADACCLAVWEARPVETPAERVEREAPTRIASDDLVPQEPDRVFDPYGGAG